MQSYLRCAYGRRVVPAASAVTPRLGRQLRCDPAEVTPVDRRRRPKIVALQLTAGASGLVIATATIEDGGLTVYPLRFTLTKRSGSWMVDDLGGG